MSVKVGSVGMKSLYLGSQEIVKAYVGQELVLLEKKPSRLPGGYTELEFLEFNGSQYIQTNIVANRNTRILCRASPAEREVSNKSYVLFRSSVAVFSTYYTFSVQFSIRYLGSSKADAFYGVMGTSPSGAITKIADIYAPNPYDIEFDTANKTIAVSGISYTFPNNDVAETLRPFVIGCSSINQSGTLASPFSGKLYSFKLIQDGRMLLELIPSQNANGVAGFFDLVNNDFLTAPSGTNFIPGPAV